MTRNQKLGLGIVGVIVAIGLFRPGHRSSSDPGTTTSGPVTAPISYTVVEEWSLRPLREGQGWVIVIDSAYRTDAALRRLGAELHRDHPGDFILVYTDSLSATRRHRGDLDQLPAAQQRRYDRSLVASTTVVARTWLFSVDGIRQDPDTTITTITFPQ